MPTSYVVCIKQGLLDGEPTGRFRTITYLGSMKIEKQDIYAIVGDTVFHTATSGMMGEEVFSRRPVILKIPPKGKEVTWTNESEGVKIACKASYHQAKITTPVGQFTDLLKVERKVSGLQDIN